MKAYSQDLRDRVIELYKTGKYTKTALRDIFKLSYQTVFNWIKLYKETGDYSSKQHLQQGRQARFTDKNKILGYIANNPDSQGSEIRDSVAPLLPMSTFYDTLSRMGISYKKKSQNIKEEMNWQESSL
jgi:transposase